MEYDPDAEAMKVLVRWYGIWKDSKEDSPAFAEKYWHTLDGGMTVYAKLNGLDYVQVLNMVGREHRRNPANI